MLTFERVDVSIQRIPILRGIDVSVRERETVALVGRNGAGKTTTLRSVMGFTDVVGGRILFHGCRT